MSHDTPTAPATSAGPRSLTLPQPLWTESREVLPEVHVGYETWGRLAPDRSNAVLVLHALTGDSHVAGPAGPGFPTPGWWDGLIGPGRTLDTDRYFVVAPNALGGCRGTTGPASPGPGGRAWGSGFPRLTVRDQVAAEVAGADLLGIERWAAVVGGSMGGMRAVEWAVTHPDRVGALFLIATTAAASAEQIAWCSTQLHAIRADPGWSGGDYHDRPAESGPWRGLGLARRIAHVTYRSEAELATRFGRDRQPGEGPHGRYAVESYLDHHAAKLTARFDAGSYVSLTEAMNSHDVGRDRGGVPAALARITAPTVVAAVDSDRLYPPSQQQTLADGIPGAGPLRVVESPYGHDGFLIELDQVAPLLAELLEHTANTDRSKTPGRTRNTELDPTVTRR